MKTETFVNISGVSTRVVTWGKGLNEVSNNEEIILMVPGNPGYTPMYEEFLEEIYKRLGIPVWIVGHAGHEPPNKTEVIPRIAGNEKLYNVSGQVLHKQAFIEKYVPTNAKLHLVGHSIGPYIIIELLKIPAIQIKTVGNYLLFPTIEKMAESPKGKSFVAFKKFQGLVMLLAYLFALLPVIFQSLIMEALCSFSGTPKRYRSLYKDLLQPSMLEKVLFMANDEMIVVKQRATDALKANRDKIKLYYGANDGWTPQSYSSNLKRDIPEIDVEICSSNYKHAFVSKYSKEVANLVADWIQKKRST